MINFQHASHRIPSYFNQLTYHLAATSYSCFKISMSSHIKLWGLAIYFRAKVHSHVCFHQQLISSCKQVQKSGHPLDIQCFSDRTWKTLLQQCPKPAGTNLQSLIINNQMVILKLLGLPSRGSRNMSGPFTFQKGP